jgi:cytoskeletal protein CcmA (bactofilin family)
MFSKPRPNESVPQPASQTDERAAPTPPTAELRSAPQPASAPPRPKPAASVLSSDLTITGNVRSSGDIQVEGTVDGDIRSQTLIVGEGATVKGEIVAEEVVVNGRVIGRLRGLKVRLSTSARVEGDITHKTIAIESGAHFEGSVQRQEDPIGQNANRPQPNGASAPQPKPATAAPAPAPVIKAAAN